MGLGPNWYQIRSKACYIPKVSRFFVEKVYVLLTSLKVPSLACKYVVYRPEHNVKWRPHGNEYSRSCNAEMKYTNE